MYRINRAALAEKKIREEDGVSTAGILWVFHPGRSTVGRSIRKDSFS